MTSTLRTCSSRKDLVQQYQRTQKCVYLSHWRILILLVYTKTYDTVDDRTGVWVPFVVRHVTFFSLAGLMVFLPIFSCTPCSGCRAETTVRMFNYSHSDRMGQKMLAWKMVQDWMVPNHWDISDEQPLALPVLRWTGLRLERLNEEFHRRMASEC